MRLLAAFLLATALLSAQTGGLTGQIEGTLRDPAGAVIPNARITLVNTGTGLERDGQSDANGLYRFPLIPLGTYSVSAEAQGFAPQKRTGIGVSAGSTVTVDIELGVATTTTALEVSATAPITEPGRTDLGFTLNTKSIENLPLVSRNNYNFILLQPNVSGRPNTEFGVPRKVNANGFTDRINYQLDGSNNTQSDRAGIRLMPISNTYIQEVQQVNNGFSAEFGNTVGTVFNAITKSGANDLHGEAAWIFRRKNFNARPPLLSRTSPAPDLKVDSIFADGGGRIIRDKLFWFGAFEHVNRSLPSAVTVSSATVSALGLPARYADNIPFAQNIYFYMGKADWQINSSNRLSGRFNYFRNESPYNNGGGLTVESQTYLFKDRAPSWGLQLISTITATTVNELRFQLPKRYQRQVAADFTGTQPVTNISGLINFGGSPSVGLRFIEETPEWSDNFTYIRGSHSFKAGADLRYIRDNNTDVTYARYTFASAADYNAAKAGTNPKSYTNYTQTFGNPQIKYNSLFTGLYVQDNWKLRPNVTLNYGVRYDLYKIPDADPKSLVATSQKFNLDKNNFAPRAGLSYGIGREQKTVIRVNGGIFYDAPQTDVYRRALLNNGSPQYFQVSTNPGASFAPAFPAILSSIPSGFNLPVQDITTVSLDFRTFYSSNANLQITRELTQSTSLSVSYLFTKGTNLPVYRNINLIPNGQRLADGRPIFGSGRIDTRFNNILMAESSGISNYNGLNVMLNRRFSRGYQVFATYTWSHAIDDAPEQNVLDSGNFVPEDLTSRTRDRGNSLSDRRHVFTASGVLNPSWDIDSKPVSAVLNHNQLSFLFTASSGDIFNIGSNRTLNGDNSVPASLQRPLYIGRNTVRGPKIVQMDLRYSHLFPIKERYRAEFLGEFTNIFNHSNITGINTTASVDAAGNIMAAPTYLGTASLDPRLIQLGLRFSF